MQHLQDKINSLETANMQLNKANQNLQRELKLAKEGHRLANQTCEKMMNKIKELKRQLQLS